MTDSGDICALAIDGGGTRSRFACVYRGKRCETELGPANAFSDFDGAVSSLMSGLHELAAKSGTTLEDLASFPAFVGLAGVIDGQIANRLASHLPLQNAEYADDRRAPLRGALGAKDGLLAHCGTGSFLAAQIGGSIRLAGGWGYDLGDEASAQWVGRSALSQTLKHLDGFDDETAMYSELSNKFGGATGILRLVDTAQPRDFGTLAPIVTRLAQDKDVSAVAIMKTAADYISHGLNQMGWTPGRAICLTGGIGPHYASYLPSDKQKDLAAPQASPLDGALELACEKYWEQRHGDR